MSAIVFSNPPSSKPPFRWQLCPLLKIIPSKFHPYSSETVQHTIASGSTLTTAPILWWIVSAAIVVNGVIVFAPPVLLVDAIILSKPSTIVYYNLIFSGIFYVLSLSLLSMYQPQFSLKLHPLSSSMPPPVGRHVGEGIMLWYRFPFFISTYYFISLCLTVTVVSTSKNV